ASSSSPSCSAILDGDGTQQYDGTAVGSTVMANYNVLSGGQMGDCGDFSFTATENGLMGSISLDLAISFVGEDADNDGVSDSFDLDVDGNGLIEITTADELNMIRNNLAGTGLSGTAGEQGSTLGCPVDEGCNGYELMADIDLVAGGYSNWVAIGDASSPFTATFDGNDFTLSNLNIRIKHIDNQGLFGVINDAVIRNVNLVGVSVVSINDYNGYPGSGGNNIGGLVGDARGTASMIIDSSVSGYAIKGRTSVGGLIGKGEQVQIIRSAATFTKVTGLDGQFVGGLLGNGGASPAGAQISSSSATIGSIVSDNEIGGLVGKANNVRVKSSVARVNSIAPTMRTGGKVNMGGLLGNANLAHVSGSMAIVLSIGGGTQVAGGLIGNANEATVTSSAAITDSIRTIERISGGLLGIGTSSTVDNSYATARNVLSNIESLQGGLIGLPHTGDNPETGLATVSNSYWDSTRLANADDRLFAENNTGSGSDALGTTNDFTAGGVFAEWGKVYVNRATGNLEIFNIPPDTAPDTSPDTGTHTQTWNLDAFPDQYPLLNLLPISLAEQNAAINRVVMGLDPVSDLDNDGILNELDVDFDGDGLIEIATADELDMIRNNLAGTGFSDTVGEPGENSGCPVDAGCNGYELIANIDLVAGGYSNWVPIGDVSSPFTAIFDGNDFYISNLAISVDAGDGLGLFGVISDAVIRNVHLYGVSIAAPSSSSVGSLVGFAQGLLATVQDSSASGSSITGVGGVGGLVGDGRQMQIINSGVTFDSITTTGSRVGGLLGYGAETNLLRRNIPDGGARISSSYATIGSISGAWNIGGLVGHADNTRIRNSVVRIGTMTFTGGDSGGLIGRALYADISGTMTIIQSIIGTRRAGGLIGYGAATRVTSSVAIVHSITGSEATAGGLIADASISLISNSYAVTTSISSTDPSRQGGFIGGTEVGQPAVITDSYWDNMLLTTPDTRNENADVIGAGTDVLGTTNDFDAGGIFAEWGKVYVNLATGDLETFDIPSEAVPDASTHSRAWNLDAFPAQYPLFGFLPISLAEQNAAINSVLANESPVPAR
nr:hypothetical protein [Gammaproteobacteria bacterium]